MRSAAAEGWTVRAEPFGVIGVPVTQRSAKLRRGTRSARAALHKRRYRHVLVCEPGMRIEGRLKIVGSGLVREAAGTVFAVGAQPHRSRPDARPGTFAFTLA